MEGGGYRDEVQSQEGTTIVADSTAPVWSAAVNGGGAVAVEMHDKATQTEEGRRRNTYKQRKDRAWNQRKAKKRAEEKTAATATADADADADDEKTQRPATKYSEGDKQPSNRAIKKAIREKNKEVRQQQQQQQQTMNGAKREEEGAASGGNASEAAAAAALRGGGNKREGGKKENAKTRRNWAWKARDKERARGKKEALERGEGVK
ncbi:MAG: hypothetical protein M1835_001707 [Candelina submexicana]|nr:MAG: hypothetical protein M1835_001707 [Candelina submexicana]